MLTPLLRHGIVQTGACRTLDNPKLCSLQDLKQKQKDNNMAEKEANKKRLDTAEKFMNTQTAQRRMGIDKKVHDSKYGKLVATRNDFVGDLKEKERKCLDEVAKKEKLWSVCKAKVRGSSCTALRALRLCGRCCTHCLHLLLLLAPSLVRPQAR